jgi:dCMP deaminase
MRIDTEDYFLLLCQTISMKSSCERRKVGAVLTKEKRVISTGYNGSVPGSTNCDSGETCQSNGRCILTIHAEINALMRAREVADQLWCTDTPCFTCLKSILSYNPEIEIIWLRKYEDAQRDEYIEKVLKNEVNIRQFRSSAISRNRSVINSMFEEYNALLD